jgi:hypothetical protein
MPFWPFFAWKVLRSLHELSDTQSEENPAPAPLQRADSFWRRLGQEESGIRPEGFFFQAGYMIGRIRRTIKDYTRQVLIKVGI